MQKRATKSDTSGPCLVPGGVGADVAGRAGGMKRGGRRGPAVRRVRARRCGRGRGLEGCYAVADVAADLEEGGGMGGGGGHKKGEVVGEGAGEGGRGGGST